ncbi:MAG: hypothetical protein ACI4QI_02280 [Candidatus Coproplasma sp.]
MAKKEKKQDDLDTETTFADMNVEGFRWYDPNRKKNGGKKTNKNRVSRKEYWAMVRAAFVAYIPVFVIVTAVFGIVACIAWIWVG